MKLLSKLISHELISGSFYIFLGSMVSNILAFLLNLYLARSLSYADYAIFASLLSVITLLSMPANSLNSIIVKFATGYFVKKENNKLKNLYLLFFKLLLGLCAFIILIFIIFAGVFNSYLHLDNIWYPILTGLVISLFFLNSLNMSFLQSLLKFGFISFTTAFGGIIKLIFGVILVILGLKAFAGIWSIFFMTLGMFIFAFFPLANVLKSKSSEDKIQLNTKKIFSYAFPTLITILFLTSFTSTDVILVKHFFNPHLAGFYAGLSLIGKVIFYFTLPIPLVMFPLLVKRHSTGAKFVNLFYIALLLVIIPSISITVFYFLRPNLVVNLFLGGKEYLYISKYLGIFGLYLTIFSMVNVSVSFFLSLNKTKIAIPVVVAAVLQVILIYMFHSDFYQIIEVSLLTSTTLFVFLIAIFIKNFTNLTRIKESVPYINNPGL